MLVQSCRSMPLLQMQGVSARPPKLNFQVQDMRQFRSRALAWNCQMDKLRPSYRLKDCPPARPRCNRELSLIPG